MNNLCKYSLLVCQNVIKSSKPNRRLQTPQLRLLSISTTLKNAANIGSQTKSKGFFHYAKIFGITVGALTGSVGIYGFYKMRSMSASLTDEYVLKEPPPTNKVARSIQNPCDTTGLKFTLYQYQTCPFCCKVRTFLDYFGFSYDVIEVNSVTHAQTKWSSYKKVPFLLVEDPESGTIMQLKDSTLIVSVLHSVLTNPGMSVEEAVKGYPVADFENDASKSSYMAKLFPPKKTYMNKYFLMNYALPKNRTKEDMVLERKWRRWVDDIFVHMLSPNVYRNLEEAYQAFNWFSEVGNWEEHFTVWERQLVINSGSWVMYLIGKKLKSKYGLKEDVRESLYIESEVWLSNIRKAGGRFMGGDEPNLADLSMYGVLMAIEGCDAFKDLRSNTKIDPWYSLMKDSVQGHSGAKFLSERGRLLLTS